MGFPLGYFNFRPIPKHAQQNNKVEIDSRAAEKVSHGKLDTHR